MKLAILVIFFFWLYHYIGFRRKYGFFSRMLIFLQMKLSRDPGNIRTMRSIATTLIYVQQYKEAYALLQELLDTVSNDSEAEKIIRTNMDFCMHPLPWVHGLKDHNHSYWHNFLLVRFGSRRYPDFIEEDELGTKKWLRQMALR